MFFSVLRLSSLLWSSHVSDPPQPHDLGILNPNLVVRDQDWVVYRRILLAQGPWMLPLFQIVQQRSMADVSDNLNQRWTSFKVVLKLQVRRLSALGINGDQSIANLLSHCHGDADPQGPGTHCTVCKQLTNTTLRAP